MVLLPVLLTLGAGRTAALKATALFADGVVLQTSDDGGPGARVTGVAGAGAAVTLSGLPQQASATAGADGKFSLQFNASSGGPYTLKLSSGGHSITAANAMIGDVYLCSGQSNMVFPVGPGNDYPIEDGGQSMANATAEILAANHPDMRMWALPTGTPQHTTPSGPNGYNGSLIPVANLTGGCNFTCDTPVPYPQGKPPPGPTGGCPTMSQCGYDDPDLIHSWTAVTPSTVKQISAVCYLTARDVKRAHASKRAVGLIAAYIGGTPVEAYANDAALDTKTCAIRPNSTQWPGGPRSVPCAPEQGKACPGRLYNELIAPLVGFQLRAALWYQGEANSDEGYHRSTSEYACEFEHLITSWRAAWGYVIPFFWVQLHPWGPGGETHGAAFGDDGFAITQIRLAQSIVEQRLPLTGQAIAYDCCSEDPPATDPESGAKSNAGSCNLHPQDKACPATRLAKRVLQVAFGVGTNATQAGPTLAGAKLSNASGVVTVRLSLANADGLALQPAKVCEKIKPYPLPGQSCCDVPGLLTLNATMSDGSSAWINGTAKIDGSSLVGSWAPPLFDQSGAALSGKSIAVAHSMEYACAAVPKCAAVNSAGMPLPPLQIPL